MAIRRALGISGLTEASSFLLNLVSVIVVSRLLSPDEIGIYSVSVTLVGLAHILRDFGIGQYIVQAPQLTRDHLRAAFTVMLITGWLLAAVVFLARSPIAAFYNQNGIAEVLQLVALSFLIMPFGAPILSLLRREMLFGKIALTSLSSNLVQVSVTILAALNGQSYMSMAWGSIAGMLTSVFVLLLINPRETFQLPTLKGLGTVFNFGSKASVASLVTDLGNSAADLIFGRTLGFAAVAYFSRAMGLVSMATGQINQVVQGVFFPAFAKEARNGTDLAALYAKAVGHMTGITMPLLGFFALIAGPLIEFMFGSQWLRSGPLASLICIFALIASPFVLANHALLAVGKVGLSLRIQSAVQGTRIAILLLSLFLTLEEVVVLLVIPTIISCGLYFFALKSTLGLSIQTLWSSLRSSIMLLAGTFSTTALIVLMIHTLEWQPPLFYYLATTSSVFAVTWLSAVFLIKHPLRNELSLLKEQSLKRFRPSSIK